MKRIRSVISFSFIVITMFITSSVTAHKKPTMEELIAYLETNIPVDTGITTHFSAQLVGKQMLGTKQEKYRVKILNKDLMIIEKGDIKIAKGSRDNKSIATAQTNFTEVIKLKNLNPKISLIYKINPTVGDESINVIYPPHIKIRINAKPTRKWKRYNTDIDRVIAMLNDTDVGTLEPFSETDSYLLLTTDEEAAKIIGKTLSHLILLCQQ